VLTYAVPKEQLEGFIPECLTLDTLNDQWAFLAIAMVKTKSLRPKGFSEWLGNDFHLTGYRIFVRYTTSQGKRLRGLYILKSETDKKKMALLGNIFTHYKYTTTDIGFTKDAAALKVRSEQADLDIEIDLKSENVHLPQFSPFKDWKEARRFAGPLPFTFSYNARNKEVLIIEGVRDNWNPKPVEVIKSHVGFIEKLQFHDCVLANAFILQNIPYYWKKGEKDTWKG
jgi:uncharacterized protein YqjF (DUF2071 family)